MIFCDHSNTSSSLLLFKYTFQKEKSGDIPHFFRDISTCFKLVKPLIHMPTANRKKCSDTFPRERFGDVSILFRISNREHSFTYIYICIYIIYHGQGRGRKGGRGKEVQSDEWWVQSDTNQNALGWDTLYLASVVDGAQCWSWYRFVRMLQGGLRKVYGACELEYYDTLLLACQQHGMVISLFRVKKWHSKGCATYSLCTHLSLPN